MSSLRFYTIFGRHTPSHRPQRSWARWILWPLLALLTIAALAGIAILVTAVLRNDFETRQLPPFDRNLSVAMSDSRFVAGDPGTLTVTLANPGPADVAVPRLVLQVPPHFLDAFTVDDYRPTVERGVDGSGRIIYTGLKARAGRQNAFTIPLRASQPGNYSGQLRLQMELAVPAPAGAWYVSYNPDGTYPLTIERSIAPEIRVVPK